MVAGRGRSFPISTPKGVMRDRGDKLVLMLARVAHALKMALVVTGVAFVTAALAFIALRPDDGAARAMAAALRSAPEPVAVFGPRDWTHVCLGGVGEDIRGPLSVATGLSTATCQGDNRWTALYGHYAEIGLAGPTGCTIIPVHRDLFTPAAPDGAVCHPRRGLMFFELTETEAGAILSVTRY